MRENPSLKKFGSTGQEKVIRKRECGVRRVLSYFGTGEGEERRIGVSAEKRRGRSGFYSQSNGK